MTRAVPSNRKVPGISELLSAIIVIGVMAVTAGILYGIFAERSADTAESIDTRIEESIKKANELLAVSSIECDTGGLRFILHNYSDSANIHANATKFYRIVNGSVEANSITSTLTWTGFDGSTGSNLVFYNGTSMILKADPFDCSDELLMITPAGEHVEIRLE